MEKICFHLSRNDDSNSLNTCSPRLQNWAETDSSEKGNSCTVDADVSNRNRFRSLRGRRLKRKGRGFGERENRRARREGGRDTPGRKLLFSLSRLLIMYAKITQL